MDKYLQNLLDSSHKKKPATRQDKRLTVHATDLIDFCPRAFAYCHKNKVMYRGYRYLGKAEALTYEIGHAIQDIVAKRLLHAKALLTSWKCLNCGVKTIDIFRTNKCHVCGHKFSLRMVDTTLILNVARDIDIVGNVDTFVLYSDGRAFANEIKSIMVQSKRPKATTFENITQPIGSHRVQALVYLWLLKKKATMENHTLPDVKFMSNVGTVTYVAKEYHKDPFKVFKVEYGGILEKGLEKELDNNYKILKQYATTKKLPKRICGDPFDSMARKCNVRNKCLT